MASAETVISKGTWAENIADSGSVADVVNVPTVCRRLTSAMMLAWTWAFEREGVLES